MDRILAGVDGSAGSCHALAWAGHLAERSKSALTAAWVVGSTEEGEAVLPDARTRRYDRLLADLDSWCTAAGRHAGEPDRVLLHGIPAEALLGEAHRRHADLLVIGSRGTGGFATLRLGGTAHHLAHHTTVPLAIVPAAAPLSLDRLVVGADGSPGSAAAMALAAGVASTLGIPVTVVYVAACPGDADADAEPGGWRRRAERDLGTWCGPLDQVGLAWDGYVDSDRDVHPVAAFEAVLQAHAGSAAVVGTRGAGGFEGLRLGRVPLQLVHHTGHAVILVPRPEPVTAPISGGGRP